MHESTESASYRARDKRQSVQTVGVIAGLILFICVVFGGLFSAAHFIG
ncbi:hypothetical protein [Methylobacterium dankookense]|uniref:Uncharacterized protein n=1 Tax=Methylobacterium dankookense TaxID=560405 RepID=A0A564FVW4_9HYPH|nr:hypothetical protein [Methylobacterium dankookense]GJD54920.1 hypothetical protein IFDJLNFL_0799 [Methylobacterium dankookense]VUF11918.1 hypothetical protein MTDSW087_01603 [Methylobacterium dankookense]